MKKKQDTDKGETVLDFDKLFSRKHVLEALTGVAPSRFDDMSTEFGQLVGKGKRGEKGENKAKRGAGRGRKHTLRKNEEKLFFILFYTHVHPTQQTAADLLGVSVGSVNNWIARYQPLLSVLLESELESPDRKIRSVKELMEKYPSVEQVMSETALKEGRDAKTPYRDAASDNSQSGTKKTRSVESGQSKQKDQEEGGDWRDDYMDLLMQL